MNKTTAVINGVSLTEGQIMTLWVALNSFNSNLDAHGLGTDPVGIGITNGYKTRIKELYPLFTGTEEGPALHPDTADMVDNTVLALKAKLLNAQEKYELKDGALSNKNITEDDGKRFFVSPEGCVKALHGHLLKGDILDSMAYLVFLHHMTGESDKVDVLASYFGGINNG